MSGPSCVLYIGMTSKLEKRVFEHKQKLIEGFTKRYNLTKLVYFESTDSVHWAIGREKQLKGWLRKRKIELIESVNPEWKDLAADWFAPEDFQRDPSLRSG
ncbi:MAG: GIY-YIG nuclease family protein [Calditrichaeota bacterium]|nr:GIY-YIG nuclease family protein [Calditrichota bacterium]MCB9369726.1 GIY-YIG nuclease family protein [Calditrichota bacterium]